MLSVVHPRNRTNAVTAVEPTIKPISCPPIWKHTPRILHTGANSAVKVSSTCRPSKLIVSSILVSRQEMTSNSIWKQCGKREADRERGKTWRLLQIAVKWQCPRSAKRTCQIYFPYSPTCCHPVSRTSLLFHVRVVTFKVNLRLSYWTTWKVTHVSALTLVPPVPSLTSWRVTSKRTRNFTPFRGWRKC